jgi:hypothetical protein
LWIVSKRRPQSHKTSCHADFYTAPYEVDDDDGFELVPRWARWYCRNGQWWPITIKPYLSIFILCNY